MAALKKVNPGISAAGKIGNRTFFPLFFCRMNAPALCLRTAKEGSALRRKMERKDA
jgi:hypothetical protein